MESRDYSTIIKEKKEMYSKIVKENDSVYMRLRKIDELLTDLEDVTYDLIDEIKDKINSIKNDSTMTNKEQNECESWEELKQELEDFRDNSLAINDFENYIW